MASPPAHGRHAPAVVALVCAGAVATAACTSAVRVQPYERSDSPECLAAAEHWPAMVGRLPQRVTATESTGVAAWGDPAVIARCGATSPGPTTDTCLDVNGVDWIATEFSDGWRFTTYGRDPAIEVLVPSAHAPEPLLLPAFTAAAGQIPQGEQRCR